MSYDPEAILWLGFTSKDKAVQERFNNFLKVWPEAHQRIPHLLMQEMRITPELPIYAELTQKIFLELIDGKLTTPEEMRAFLEPYSPPAPPPQVTIKRPRAKRGAARIKEPALEDEDSEDALPEEDLDSMGGDDEELDLAVLPKGALGDDAEGDDEEEEADDEDEADAPPNKKLAGKKGQKPVPAGKQAVGARPLFAKAAAPSAPAKAASAKPQPVSASPKSVPGKPALAPAPAKTPAPAKAAPAKAAVVKPAKAAAKPPAKKPVPAKAARPKPKAKPAPKPVKKAHPKPSKPATKKPAPKAGKKR
jgi:hypothetical protein